MGVLKAPGTPYQQGSSPSVVKTNRAPFMSGIDSRLAAASIAKAKEIGDTAQDIGDKVIAFAKKKHADDTILGIQSATDGARDYSMKLLQTGFDSEDPSAPKMADGSAWVPITQREGMAAKGAMGEYDTLMKDYIASQKESMEVGGKYAQMLDLQFSGVYSSGKVMAGNHENAQHSAAKDSHFQLHLNHLQQEAASMAFLPDAAVIPRMDAMIRDALAPYSTDVADGKMDPKGPLYAAKEQAARQAIWTALLQSRIKSQPGQAMGIVAQLAAPEGEREGNFWKVENIAPGQIQSLIAEARTAYVSDLSFRADSLVEGGKLDQAVTLLQDEGKAHGLTNSEVAGLVKDARSYEASIETLKERKRSKYFRDLGGKALNTAMSSGQIPTRKELYKMGFTDPAELNSIKSTIESIFDASDAKKGDDASLFLLKGIVDGGGMYNGKKLEGWDDSPISALAANKDTAELLKKLDGGMYEKLASHIKSVPAAGSTAATNRTFYLDTFKSGLEASGMKKGDQEYNRALEMWQMEYERLSKEGGEMTAPKLIDLNKWMAQDWIVGRGKLGGAKTLSGWQIRSQQVSGELKITPEVSKAVTDELNKMGFVNPTQDQILKIINDPLNSSWIDDLDAGQKQKAGIEGLKWTTGGFR